ncbi:ABC-three component system protein [Stutzerimonas nitrititolerans]|uniref:ABC-three component system protein n=1 Tax=Stutzerimonas nitrititolerans TaxID=2482751 RepID=UPI0028B0907B|nr:ABC-three component system protein [Stutzerimonas nitrititolerans]
MLTRQSGNVVQGDMAAGNVIKTVNNYYPSASVEELALLYAKLRLDGIGDPSNNVFSHKLMHYLAVPTDGDVRGLEAKLRDSGRLDMLHFAMREKEAAVKMLMRYQSSRSAQRVFTILLDELHTIYILTVTPVIENGGDRATVDEKISNALQVIKSMLGENFLEFTVKDLLGLLFFLAGNCHIRWDKDADLSPGI